MNIKFLLLVLAISITFTGFMAQTKNGPRLGLSSNLDQDSIAHVAGFEMIGESVRRILSPTLSEAAFQSNLNRIKTAKCQVIMCNLFFPATLKIAGPDVSEVKVLAYSDSVLTRANKAGIKFIVLGSGGSRQIPADYDIQKAKTDFVKLARKLGDIAKRNGVTIVLENLETTETNFITSLKSAAEVVGKINHPNFKLNADIFHMMRENESPAEIVAASKLIRFCEVAEKEQRTLPGVKGDDFKPYLNALKKINYKGFIFIEAGTQHPKQEIPLAFKYMTAQINEVWGSK